MGEAIRTLQEFIKWANNAQHEVQEQQKEPLAFFYRGHSDAKYQIQPGAYRQQVGGKSYRVHEYHLYQTMWKRNPAAFADDKTTFERLVRMQHYGLPTRLLDVSENHLVALFFACESEKKRTEDGEVILFSHPQKQVLFSQAIPGHSLDGLEYEINFAFIINQFLERLFTFFQQKKGTAQSDVHDANFLPHYEAFLDECINKLSPLKGADTIATVSAIGELECVFIPQKVAELGAMPHHTRGIGEYPNPIFSLQREIATKMKAAISECCADIRFSHGKYAAWYDSAYDFLTYFFNVLFVYPPENNERIRRQQGAFLIFPPLEVDTVSLWKGIAPLRITIAAAAKETLLHELSQLGFTKGRLFPELAEQAKDICHIYPPA